MQAAVRDELNGMEAASHLVVRLEFERSISGSHEHIAGVWTSDDEYVTRANVLRSIARGDQWWSLDDGQQVAIRKVRYCPWPGCSVIPYVDVAGANPDVRERGRR